MPRVTPVEETVEDYLRGVLREATKRFPEVGFFLLSTEDHDEIEERELTSLTNMHPEEIDEVLEKVQEQGEWKDADPAKSGRMN